MGKLSYFIAILKLISCLTVTVKCALYSKKVAEGEVACSLEELPDFTVDSVKTKLECILWCLKLNEENRTCSRINFYDQTNQCLLYSSGTYNTTVITSPPEDGCVGYEMKRCMDQTYTNMDGIGTCIKVITSKTNWSNAQEFCNNNAPFSSHLVIINNMLEFAEISRFLASRNDSHCFSDSGKNPYFWTAGQRIDPNNITSFVWKPYPGVDLQFFANGNIWFPGEPNFSGSIESCALMWKQFKFNDASCSNTFCFVCQMQMEPVF